MPITSVTGTVSNGQSIVVRGSGFGANGPNVLLFDDFEGGTNGNDFSLGNAPVGTWRGMDLNSSNIIYSGTNKISGGLAVRFKGYDYPPNRNPYITTWIDSPINSYYVSAWMLPVNGVDNNWKAIWIFDFPVGGDPDNQIGDLCTMRSPAWGHWFGNDIPAGFPTAGEMGTWHDKNGDESSQLFPTTGRWDRLQWSHRGRVDNSGEVLMTFTNTNGTWDTGHVTGTPTLTNNNVSKKFNINGYVLGTGYYQAWDDIYIAIGEYSRARVEIGNASTYATCTSLTPCTTPYGAAGAAWSDTAVTCTVRGGNIAAGNAWLYVTDANGTMTAGFPVTFGGGSAQPPLGIPTLSVR
jgi:hypothetical protein